MIAMEVFMDIFALRRQGLSLRAISRKLGIHRNTVTKYLQNGSAPCYQKRQRKSSILDPYRHIISAFVHQDDYQATWIFERIRKMGYQGSYELVKIFVRQLKEQLQRIAYARFETEPGHQAQMDWADFQISEPNAKTTTIHLFALLLGFSRTIYGRFVERCTLQHFMDCHIQSFHYLGGVPSEVLYDNMKNVVIGRKKDKVIFNNEFLHFAHHYRFQPIPCPPYSPWVKGKIERPIDYIRERFWRGYRFESVQKANQDLRRWLDEVANQRVHGTHRQPVVLRWQQELADLGKLPSRDYDTSLKVFRKVYKDCQVSYETNRYVLPHTVVGKKVMLKIKNGTIRFYDDDQLLATYNQPQGKHQLVANPFFYEQLKRAKDQLRRKYGRSKGKATRGLVDASLFPQVMHRPLADYEAFAKGGAPWSN